MLDSGAFFPAAPGSDSTFGPVVVVPPDLPDLGMPVDDAASDAGDAGVPDGAMSDASDGG